MSIPASDKKVTCSACGKIMPIGKTEEHTFACEGKKNENRI